MLAFLKGFPFTHYIIMAAIGAAVWVYGDLVLTKQALESQRQLTQQWQNAAETLQAIDTRRTVIVQVASTAEDAVLETENADQPVSPDVAAAHADGINRVRDAWTGDAPKHVVPRPDTATPSKGNVD
jgi:hypothetical protein